MKCLKLTNKDAEKKQATTFISKTLSIAEDGLFLYKVWSVVQQR